MFTIFCYDPQATTVPLCNPTPSGLSTLIMTSGGLGGLHVAVPLNTSVIHDTVPQIRGSVLWLCCEYLCGMTSVNSS